MISEKKRITEERITEGTTRFLAYNILIQLVKQLSCLDPYENCGYKDVLQENRFS